MSEIQLTETDIDSDLRDPDETPIRNRKLIIRAQDMTVDSMVHQLKDRTIHVRPLSEKPRFQRNYVWPDKFASKLIESLLLNVPIPPIYLSETEDYEYDVIDGQQRVYSIYRFLDNQFKLQGLEVLSELNKLNFFEIPSKLQSKLKHCSIRCIVITSDSHPEIKFEVFERLNTNTTPLNSQELRNCINRGRFNELLGELSEYEPWLKILGRKKPDKRLRDEELILRFFSFYHLGLDTYRTPQKHWLNDMAKVGSKLDAEASEALGDVWRQTIDRCLIVFEPDECFRRSTVEADGKKKAINKALMDIVLNSFTGITDAYCKEHRDAIRQKLINVQTDPTDIHQGENFDELVSRAVDHTSRVKKRFKIWADALHEIK